MNTTYTYIVICLFLLSGINKPFANSLTPLFFDCPTDTLSLCVENEGEKLSAGFSLKDFGIYTIDGYIRSVKNKGIPGVVVRIEDSHQAHPSVLTDSTGHYITTFSEDGKLITITPEKTDNPKSGISTLDLVRIQRHLLGNPRFTTPYEYISADANNSQTVTAIDLVELRKLILGIYTELPNNQSWRFVASNFQLDSLNPWPYPGSRTVLVDHSIYDINFTGIKIGDVSNAVPFTSDDQIEIRNAKPEIVWVADQQSYQKGDEIEIKIRSNSSIDLQGFQLTIASTDLLFTDVTSASLELDESTYSNFGDKTTMSWFDENGVDLMKGETVFTLKAVATQSGNLKTGLSINSEITEAEVYSMKDEIFTPQLLIHDDSKAYTSTLMPNPWKEQATIAINLKEEGITEIEIMDLNGRSIYSETKHLLKGNNEIVLESKNFEARGLLMYSIKTEREILSGKMVVLE